MLVPRDPHSPESCLPELCPGCPLPLPPSPAAGPRSLSQASCLAPSLQTRNHGVITLSLSPRSVSGASLSCIAWRTAVMRLTVTLGFSRCFESPQRLECWLLPQSLRHILTFCVHCCQLCRGYTPAADLWYSSPRRSQRRPLHGTRTRRGAPDTHLSGSRRAHAARVKEREKENMGYLSLGFVWHCGHGGAAKGRSPHDTIWGYAT